MTFAEFADRIDKLIDILEDERSKVALENTADVLALVKNRVINERKDPDGQSFGKYSDAVVPFWFYRGKETKRSNQAAVDDLYQSVGYFASYQDWRGVNNLTGDQINVSFTGKMWKLLKPVVVNKTATSTTIGWVIEDQEKDTIMGYHLNRFPQLLDLSAKEDTITTTLNQERIDDAIRKAGLA